MVRRFVVVADVRAPHPFVWVSLHTLTRRPHITLLVILQVCARATKCNGVPTMRTNASAMGASMGMAGMGSSTPGPTEYA